MNPIVHTELSWLCAHYLRERRDRILVTVAGVLPDLDGLAILSSVDDYGRYHHRFTHGFIAGLVLAALAAALARSRLRAALLALAVFHLHLVCDLVGSGPGWPLFYFVPFSEAEWFWSGQWDLASWQNGLIAMLASFACLATAFWVRRTVVEIFSRRADEAVVRALWSRFRPGTAP